MERNRKRMNVFQPADILIPKKEKVQFETWSVVACDQYTSQKEYWEQVEKNVGASPSTLRITFPEIYLEKGDGEDRIKSINQTMEDYLSQGLFDTLEQSFIYVERTQRDGRIRHGLIGAVDLEQYDFHQGSKSYIRATEGTVLERIPPRVKIRENAPLELPHILMLIDDRDKQVIEPLTRECGAFTKIYDFDLMMDSGRLRGWQVPVEKQAQILSALDALADQRAFEEKYGVSDMGVLLFAVGDGNHSLATAKTCWENLKQTLSPEERKTHPARFALVEVMNLHEEALEFEPIHRVVFGVDSEDLVKAFMAWCAEQPVSSLEPQQIHFLSSDGPGVLLIHDPPCNLAVGTLQQFLDEYLKEHGGSVDYIHGADVVEQLSAEKGTVGFLLPKMEKNQLFETILHDGVLPRKTFSMGEAEDKRFYLECKKIR